MRGGRVAVPPRHQATQKEPKAGEAAERIRLGGPKGPRQINSQILPSTENAIHMNRKDEEGAPIKFC